MQNNTIFSHFFSPCSSVQKTLIFYSFLPPLIRTQEGVKSGRTAKLHLNSTFCLSQSLPQSCNTKNYRRLSGASKCCKLRCFMNVPCILPAKKGSPPPAKADCVSASGKTRPFAPTVRADFYMIWHRFMRLLQADGRPGELVTEPGKESFPLYVEGWATMFSSCTSLTDQDGSGLAV